MRLNVYSIDEAKRLTAWQEERQVAVPAGGRFEMSLELDSIPRPADSMVRLQVVFDPTIQSDKVTQVVGTKGRALEDAVQVAPDDAAGVNRLSYDRGVIRFATSNGE